MHITSFTSLVKPVVARELKFFSWDNLFLFSDLPITGIYFPPYILTSVSVIGCFLFLNAQEKPFAISSVSYSPNIIINEYGRPFYEKFEVDFVIYNKVRLKLSQGIYGATHNEYNNTYKTSDFYSFTGYTGSLDLVVTPVKFEKFCLSIGGGPAFIFHKEFVTKAQVPDFYVTADGKEEIIIWQLLDLREVPMLGIDFFMDIEYKISPHFSLSAGFNVIGASPEDFSYGYIYPGINFTYIFNNY